MFGKNVKASFSILFLSCGCSSIWLEHSPVTGEAAGSSPVNRAKNHLIHITLFMEGLENFSSGKEIDKEKLKRLELVIVEPRMDKGYMIAFTSENKKITRVYNQAIKKVLEAHNLKMFHQVGVTPKSEDNPGYHAWEIWNQIDKQILEGLFEEIHKEAEI